MMKNLSRPMVTGLLAAVADTLAGGLLGAVAGQMTDLAAYSMLESHL